MMMDTSNVSAPTHLGEYAQQAGTLYRHFVQAGIPHDLAADLVRDWHRALLGDDASRVRAMFRLSPCVISDQTHTIDLDDVREQLAAVIERTATPIR